jgi:hypothetical protein
MRPGCGRNFDTAEHAGDFFDALVSIQGSEMR